MHKKPTSNIIKAIAVCLPPFMVGLDVLLMSVAIVPMANSLNAHTSTIQWFMSGYGIGAACFLVPAGKLADMFGYRRMLLIGILLFTLTSALVAASSSAHLIILWRVLQGVSGSLALASILPLMNDAFTPDKRNIVLGMMIGSAGLGIGLSPIIGGLIVTYASWPAAFWINVPIGIICCLLVIRSFPAKDPSLFDRRFDFFGLILMLVSLVLLTIGVSQGPIWGWNDYTTLCCLSFAVILFAGFLWHEQSFEFPLLSLNLFKATNFSIACVAGFTAYFVMLSWLFIVSLFLPRVFNLSPLQVGIAELPFSLSFFLSGFIIGRFINKVDHKLVVCCGLIAMLASTILLAFATHKTTYAYFGIAFGLLGVGFVTTNAASLATMIKFIPTELMGLGFGTSMLFRWLGVALGVAIISVVYISASVSSLTTSIAKHVIWEHTLPMPQLTELVTKHGPVQTLISNIDDPKQLAAAKDAYMQAYSHGLMASMWVLSGLIFITLLLVIKRQKRVSQ